MSLKQQNARDTHGKGPPLLGWDYYYTPRGRVYYLDHNTHIATLVWPHYDSPVVHSNAGVSTPSFSFDSLRD